MRKLPWLILCALFAIDAAATDGFRKRWSVADAEALLQDGWKKDDSGGRSGWTLPMEGNVETPFWRGAPNQWAVEVRVRIARSNGPEGCDGGPRVLVNDGHKWALLSLGVDSFRLQPSGAYGSLDTTKDFHVFRLEAHDEKLTLRIDGGTGIEGRFSPGPPAGEKQAVSFGHFGACDDRTATWDYVQLESTPFPAPVAIAPEPGPTQCKTGYLVTRCIGQGVACTPEHPCAPARCSTTCESVPPAGDNRSWSCHCEGRRCRCSALIPGRRTERSQVPRSP